MHLTCFSSGGWAPVCRLWFHPERTSRTGPMSSVSNTSFSAPFAPGTCSLGSQGYWGAGMGPSTGSLRPQQNPVGSPVMCQMNGSCVWSRGESPCCIWLCDSNLIQVHRDVCVVFSGTLPICLGYTGRQVGFPVLSCRSSWRPVFISVCECVCDEPSSSWIPV